MNHKPSTPRSVEKIIRILRQVDGDRIVADICWGHNISEQTSYRWKKKFGGMDLADAKRMKGLEKENLELKKMLAEAMLDNRVLRDQCKNGKPAAKKRAVRHVAHPRPVLEAARALLK